MYSVSSGSEAISRDMDNLLFSSNFKYSSLHPDFSKTKPTFHHHHSHTYNNNSNYAYNLTQQQEQQQQQQQQQSSSLARYRSAPSSFFASLLNDVDEEENEDRGGGVVVVAEEEVMMFPEMMNMKQEGGGVVEDEVQQDYGGGVSSAGMVFGAHATTTTNTTVSSVAVVAPAVVSESSFRGMDVLKKSGGGGGSLLRQSSSPAGFLSNLVDEIGFGSTSDMGSFRANNRTNMSFSSWKSSHSRFMPKITENGNANVEMSSQQNGQLGNGHNGDHSNRHYLPTIPNASSFNGLKRNRDGEMKMFSNLSGLDTQNGGSKHDNSGLLHQLSLPSTSAEIESIENLLQFQQDNVVPCKIRAKRGFATHPRSIAERVRRTRISERMKKLQELFPNMDKQANTADMLDLAVEFIKDLQKEVQTLNETRARCTCSSKIKQSSPA